MKTYASSGSIRKLERRYGDREEDDTNGGGAPAKGGDSRYRLGTSPPALLTRRLVRCWAGPTTASH
jgi:hypothetical protein